MTIIEKYKQLLDTLCAPCLPPNRITTIHYYELRELIELAEIGNGKWISCTERKPRIGKPVLAYWHFTNIINIAKYYDYKWEVENSTKRYCEPDYWMELPKLPVSR